MHDGNDRISRREFVAATGSAAALAMAPAGLWPARAGRQAAGTTVLFQGDSITDCGRDRGVAEPNVAAALGTGYPLLVAARLLSSRPEAGYRIFDRGVSGNTVPDLDARWQPDTLDLKPDVLSILIGVNDLWHKLMGRYAGTIEEYEAGYAALLDRTRRALPGVRIVVLEPFALRTGAVTDAWFPEFDQRRAAAARVAERAGATFVALQAMFDRLTARAPAAYWASDGVHPTPAGHGAIAEEWMRTVGL